MPQDVSPYSTYEYLRSAGELHWTGRTWLVLSHAAVAEGLVHASLSARRVDLLFPQGAAGRDSEALRSTLCAWTFFSDVTDVKAERKFIWDQLGPKALGNLEELVVRESTVAWTRAREGKKPFDVLGELTSPLRVAIAKMFLELEHVDSAELRDACADADRVFEFITGANGSYSETAAAASMVEIKKTLLKSGIFKKTDLSEARVLDQLALLLVVSVFIEKAIANVVTVVLSRKEAWASFEKGETAALVREALRLESPTQVTSRIAIEDFEWHGKTIKSGEQVSLVIGSANRDQGLFEKASEFSATRGDVKLLTFGNGGKRCPGEWMTGAIVERVFESLRAMMKPTDSVPKIHDLAWIENPESRRPIRLSIQF